MGNTVSAFISAFGRSDQLITGQHYSQEIRNDPNILNGILREAPAVPFEGQSNGNVYLGVRILGRHRRQIVEIPPPAPAVQLSANESSVLHFRNIDSFMSSVLEKSHISDENVRRYFTHLVSPLRGLNLARLFTHPDISGPLDLAMVLECHLKSGMTRNRLLDLAFKTHNRDNPITSSEVRNLPIFKLTYHFWKFYQSHLLKEMPILEGFLGEIENKLHEDFCKGIQFEARTAAVTQALIHSGETLSEKGKDAQGRNIFTGIAFAKIALSNAERKKSEDLAKDSLIMDLPFLKDCSVQEKKAVLQAALRELSQDSEYLIGSVEHSMASTVILYSKMWELPMPNDIGDKNQLMAAFGKLCAEYDGKAKQTTESEYNPRDYAALHLVHAMGVEEKLKKEIIAEKLARATTEEEKRQAQNISAEEWHTKVRENFSQAIDAEYG
ncbi:MAG: hypothetical protein C5B47_01090, partial [Verrucomicrobia bacterium]